MSLNLIVVRVGWLKLFVAADILVPGAEIVWAFMLARNTSAAAGVSNQIRCNAIAFCVAADGLLDSAAQAQGRCAGNQGIEL